MKKYVNGKYITLTAAELAALQVEATDWLHPHRLRIFAPLSLAFERMDLILYKQRFELMGLPVDNDGQNIILYCNKIVEGDVNIIKSLPEITVEGKDDEAKQYLTDLGL